MRAFIVLVSMFMTFKSSPTYGDEGMWLYEMPPHKALKKEYNFELTPEKVEHLRSASIRLNNGGSGSFVSPNGLLLTNHHVAVDALEQISDEQHNYLKNGFLASKDGGERMIPDLEVNMLVKVQDVTAEVEAAVQANMSVAEAYRAKLKKIAQIEADASKKTGLRSDVVKLFDGARFHLYSYKKFTKVALVFAPEDIMGFFGGNTDNFEFPRYCLDMALFRVYEEDGKTPYKPAQYIQWSVQGTQKGDLTIVSGHPGGTSRHETSGELVFERDVLLKKGLEQLAAMKKDLQDYVAAGATDADKTERMRQVKGTIFSFDNSTKVYEGLVKYLTTSDLIEKKEKAEAEDLKKDKGMPGQPYAASMAQLALAQKNFVRIYEPFKLFENFREDRVLDGYTLGFGGYASNLFKFARHFVRIQQENPLPDADRLREYQDSRRASLMQKLLSEAPIYPELEEFLLARGLELMLTQLGDNHTAVQKILGGKTPQERAQELVAGTKLADPQERKRIASLSLAELKASNDSMIQLALAVDPYSRKLRTAYEDDVEAQKNMARVLIGKRLLADKNKEHYPDATFTLRFSFGKAEGYDQEGTWVEPYTTLLGIFDHSKVNIEKFSKDPDPEKQKLAKDFEIPKSWADKKGVLQDEPFNFVSTNDITGGNSGSPVVDKNLELIGLAFDGNRYSFDGDYYYNGERNRTISVDVRAMIEALKKIYGANDLVKELGVENPS